MIDLHCHLLAGIDDGPASLDESVALARAMLAGGTRTAVATPHVSSRYPNDQSTIARLTDQLSAHLTAEGVPLDVRAGAELAMTQTIDMDSEQLQSYGLGGGPWLLIEPPLVQAATGVEALLQDLQDQGHRIVLAHPERCPVFQRDPRMLGSLVRGGILTSITAGALAGRFGGSVRRFALELVEADMVHTVATDAHDLDRRAPALAADLERAGMTPLLEWLTNAVPAAILDGDETIPPRPPVTVPVGGAGGSRWWRRGPLRRMRPGPPR